jgi:hypothetical protein
MFQATGTCSCVAPVTALFAMKASSTQARPMVPELTRPKVWSASREELLMMQRPLQPRQYWVCTSKLSPGEGRFTRRPVPAAQPQASAGCATPLITPFAVAL